MLSVHNLNLQQSDRVLCGPLNFTIKPGEFWIILGENGCGKSTLLQTMSRLRMENSGTITLQEKPLEKIHQPMLAQQIGILLQEEMPEFWGRVREYILLGRHPYKKSLSGWSHTDHTIVDQILKTHALESLANRFFNTLSGGERQRVRIAQLLAQSPQYFLLDEPLQHLDIRHQLHIMTLFKNISEQNCAVVMVLHDINWLNHFGDHILMMFSDGNALSGPKEMMLTQLNLDKLYQCPIAFFKHYINIP
ncbi:MAG: ABC transporter ATP-binding protein [Nitrosomonas sp.]